MRRALLASIALAGAVVSSGCGSREPSDEEKVRATLASFADATAKKDYQRLCDEIFAPALLETLGQIGLPCEIALERAYADLESPRVVVGAIEVDGDRASAEVRSSARGEPPSQDTVELVKVGDGWRIASLATRP
jgi:hypothetical protein